MCSSVLTLTDPIRSWLRWQYFQLAPRERLNGKTNAAVARVPCEECPTRRSIEPKSSPVWLNTFHTSRQRYLNLCW